ncbi:hypothetical protein R3P38DRAFT_2905899 [Favolaschia claudopus]|uniref:DUF6534 domain-containing protein n=1 Tax=Favolaschia claudopus TaxID=2862362 RepID=A0AAW0CK64_9AGAR
MSQGQFQLEVGKLTIPLFIGTILNWALLGALAVQVYLYVLAFPKDRPVNKLVVAFIFIAELLQTLGDSRNTIETFGAGWGDFSGLDQVRWAWFSVPILGSTIACAGQLFFAWRLSVISGGVWYMPAVITVITVFQWGGGVWTGVDIIRAGRFSQISAEQLKPPIAWLSATAAADLIIVASTLYYIIKARDNEFQFESATNRSISRVIRVSAETGVLCAIFAILDLAIFVQFDGNNYHLGVCIWLSKVYSMSVMVILNSRAYIGHELPPNASKPHLSQVAFPTIGPLSPIHAPVSVHLGRRSSDLHSHTDSDSHSHLQIQLDKERGRIDV